MNSFVFKKIAVRLLQSRLLVLLLLVAFIFAGGHRVGSQLRPSDLTDAVMKELIPDTLPAEAHYQFTPTAGTIIVGTTTSNITSIVAPSANGVNTGSWRGALADDNYHWAITASNVATTGLNAILDVGRVQLNGANTLIVNTKIKESAGLNLLFQICDWVSSTSVDNAADAQCTGGGWRTFNKGDVPFNSTTNTAFAYYLFDGMWSASSTSNTTVSTPLTNFVNGSNTMKVRYYATTSSTANIFVDYLRVAAVVNPVYAPAGFVSSSTGTVTGTYMNGNAIAANAIDNTYITVTGSTTQPADFYFIQRNVQTYTGANAILVRSTYGCSVASTTFTYRPKIYNFASSSWEFLTGSSTAINCSGTATTTNAWAKSQVVVNNYVSSTSQMWIGWQAASASSTEQIKIDQQYAIIGTVNSSSTACQITLGTQNAGTCANSADLDMTGTTSTWNILAEDATTSMNHAYYPYDNDADAVLEESEAYNIPFSVTPPSNAAVTGLFYAGRFMSGTGGTVAMGLKDYSGLTNNGGGWSQVGNTVTNTLTYMDNIVVGGTATSGPDGMYSSPSNYIDTVNNQMNIRIRTTSDGASTTNSIGQMDFAFVSLQWTYDPGHFSESNKFIPVGQNIIVGSTSTNITTVSAPASTGVNVGSWMGTLADDNYHWAITGSSTAGINVNLVLGGVQLNNANTIIINTKVVESGVVPNPIFQICDYATSTAVDNPSDSQCPGGWRTINNRKVATVGGTSPVAYVYYIYDGYWATSTNVTVSTPLSNFVSTSTNQMKIRYFQTTGTTGNLYVDYLRAMAVVNPVYAPAGYVNNTTGTTTGTYMNVNAVAAGAADATYLSTYGTAASSSDFYFIMRNVQNYTGANAIMVRATYSCNAAGMGHRPKIYNFNSSAWEDLTSADIPCSAVDATNAWSKSPATTTNYINGSNQMWIGWRSTAASTTNFIKIDQLYAMLGTVNTNSGNCEISFGTQNAGTCANTDDLDMTAATTTWNILAEDESGTMTHGYYPYDNDANTTLAEAEAYNIPFAVTTPMNAAVTGLFYAANYMSGAAGTVALGLRDYSGFNDVNGGWMQVGATAASSLTYTDNLTTGGVVNGGPNGVYMNGEDYVDSVNNEMNMRIRTTTAGASTTNSIGKIDFAMVGLQWAGGISLGTLGADIVTSTGTPVATPTIVMSGLASSMSCQTATGSFGTTAQDIRISNPTINPNWTVSIAASSTTALWATSSRKYDFNDPTSGGCSDGADADTYAGQMSIDPSVGLITPQNGCQNTGLSFGSANAFSEGSVDAITLLNTSSNADTNCYWDLSGVKLSQTVPAGQAADNYSLNMIVTIVAN